MRRRWPNGQPAGHRRKRGRKRQRLRAWSLPQRPRPRTARRVGNAPCRPGRCATARRRHSSCPIFRRRRRPSRATRRRRHFNCRRCRLRNGASRQRRQRRTRHSLGRRWADSKRRLRGAIRPGDLIPQRRRRPVAGWARVGLGRPARGEYGLPHRRLRAWAGRRDPEIASRECRLRRLPRARPVWAKHRRPSVRQRLAQSRPGNRPPARLPA
jgi:hypothetical protein